MKIENAWFCENCGRSGLVGIHENAGVMEACRTVLDAHKSRSPDCESGLHRIRILDDINDDVRQIQGFNLPGGAL